MTFEEWYTGVYLPEQSFEPTQKEKSGIRFAFEEGLHHQQAKLDAQDYELKVLREFAKSIKRNSNANNTILHRFNLIDKDGSPTKLLTG